jgi:hypothetical protein
MAKYGRLADSDFQVRQLAFSVICGVIMRQLLCPQPCHHSRRIAFDLCGEPASTRKIRNRRRCGGGSNDYQTAKN